MGYDPLLENPDFERARRAAFGGGLFRGDESGPGFGGFGGGGAGGAAGAERGVYRMDGTSAGGHVGLRGAGTDSPVNEPRFFGIFFVTKYYVSCLFLLCVRQKVVSL